LQKGQSLGHVADCGLDLNKGVWAAWPRGGLRLARSMAALWTRGARWSTGPPCTGARAERTGGAAAAARHWRGREGCQDGEPAHGEASQGWGRVAREAEDATRGLAAAGGGRGVRSMAVGRLTATVCSGERRSRGREGKKASRSYLRARHEPAELRRCLPWLE